MARITFKQFIDLNESEGQDFISGTMDKMPEKYEYKTDPTTGKKVRSITKAYRDELEKYANFPASRDILKVDTEKPETTEFRADEMPKVVRSGGRAKKRAEDTMGVPKTNEYFFKGMGMFWLPPSAYTPDVTIRER